MRNISDYECMFLGGITKHPEVIYCFDDLEQKHFSSPFGFNIYDAIRNTDIEIIQKNTVLSVLVEVKRKKLISQEEFDFALTDYNLLSIRLTPDNIEYAYNKLKNEDLKMGLIKNIHNLDIQHLNIEELLENINSITEKYNHSIDKGYEVEPMDTVTKRKLVKPSGIITGIQKIDDKVKIEKNTFTILSARPFNGKTTFALKIAMENTIKHKVLFFTTEMTKEQLGYKIRFYGMHYKLQNFNIAYKPQLDLNMIVRTARKNKPDLIIIDQLNKIKDKAEKEYDKFTSIARKLKIITGELEIPIICLAQINRSAENKRPYLYQLKGSGSLEEESDVVIILHVGDEKRADNITNIYIDKNRTYMNNTGMVETRFNPENNFYEEK